MVMIPSTRAKAILVEKLANTAYDDIKSLLDVIDQLQSLSDLSDTIQDSASFLTAINEAVAEAEEAASTAETYATSASESAEKAEASDMSGIVTQSPTAWVEGKIAIDFVQRYLYDGALYICPTASESNPVTLGESPLDSDLWVDWSIPVYYFPHETTTTEDTTVIQLETSVYEIGDVFVGHVLFDSSSYTIDTVNFTLTFDTTIPSGTHIKIWVGVREQAILSTLQDYLDQTLEAATTATSNAAIATTAETNVIASEANVVESEANVISLAETVTTAEANVISLLDQLSDQYLGPYDTDPTVDNDGDPLEEGAVYFNTVDSALKFYTGTAWVEPESIATTAATNASNSATSASTSATVSNFYFGCYSNSV